MIIWFLFFHVLIYTTQLLDNELNWRKNQLTPFVDDKPDQMLAVSAHLHDTVKRDADDLKSDSEEVESSDESDDGETSKKCERLDRTHLKEDCLSFLFSW